MSPPEDPRVYCIDRVYEDRRAGKNQFIAWLKIKNSGGMRPLYRRSRQRRDGAADLAALVVVSRHVGGSGYNPWQDIIDRRQGRIWYWGDAKADTNRERDDFDGNRLLAAIWRAVGERRWNDAPPILHFSKFEKGTVRFNGVCVLSDLEDAWFEDGGLRVRNYRAVLDVLPIERCSVEWLHARAQGNDDALAPAPWSIYARSGGHQRLVSWAKQVLSERQQLPSPESADWRALEQLHALDPLVAERLVLRAFADLPIAHNIKGTPPTKDGGFDFFGAFLLPPPLGYSVAVKGEMKRYHPGENKVGPRDVARLVARLQRGEHGIFVTTSAFTRQCQEEVFADAYPVELIFGGRLVTMLRDVGAIDTGGLVASWAAG